MNNNPQPGKRPYVAPDLVVLGPVSELTQSAINGVGADGTYS